MAVSVDDDTNDDDFSFERSFRQKGWSWAKYTAEIGELILLPLVVLLAFMPTPELLAAISLDGLIGPIESVRVAGGTWAAYARFAACVRPDFEQRSASIDYAQVAAQTSPETSELGGPRSREDGRPDHRACLPPPERNVLARPQILARHVSHHRRGPIRHQHLTTD